MDLAVDENKRGERSLKHYSNSHKILLVGEGDFSFAVCLAEAFGSAVNMIATSLDSKEMLMANYSTARANLKKLEDLGCTIVHEVNAHTMSQHPRLSLELFDRIVFNFPHAGHIWYEHSELQIELHQEVVKGFMRSARDMLADKGEAHVTHKTAHPFNKWEIEKLAEEVGLCLVEKVPFHKWHYPGYDNKRGHGHRCNETFPVGECSTFKFSKP